MAERIAVGRRLKFLINDVARKIPTRVHLREYYLIAMRRVKREGLNGIRAVEAGGCARAFIRHAETSSGQRGAVRQPPFLSVAALIAQPPAADVDIGRGAVLKLHGIFDGR